MAGPLRTTAHNARRRWRRLLAFAILGAGIVAAALGYWWFFLVWVFGFFVLLPVLHTLAKPIADTGTETETSGLDGRETPDPALQTLRDRYARGDIDEAEFERRLERLLETEDAETASPKSTVERVRRTVERELTRE